MCLATPLIVSGWESGSVLLWVPTSVWLKSPFLRLEDTLPTGGSYLEPFLKVVVISLLSGVSVRWRGVGGGQLDPFQVKKQGGGWLHPGFWGHVLCVLHVPTWACGDTEAHLLGSGSQAPGHVAGARVGWDP